MGKHLWILLFVSAAVTAGCGAKAPAPVPEPVPAALPLNSFMRKWTVSVDSSAGAVQQLYLREDLLFAYTANGSSYVINRDTGVVSHVDSIPGGVSTLHPPVLTKDTIIYPQLNALQLYDRKSGQFKRTVRLPLAVRSNAVGSKGELFFGADFPGGGRVVCLDLTREFVPTRWALMYPKAAVSAAPAVLNDIVFTAGEDGRVAAVAVENREAVWEPGFFESSGPIYADLQVDETGLYVASNDSKLYCLNRTTGKVKWQYFAGVGLKATPVVTKDLVVEFVDGVGLVVLDKGAATVEPTKGPQYDRQPRWTASDATQFLAEDASYVYVARDDKSIAALDKAKGNVVFTSKEKNLGAWAINTKDGVIFTTTSENRVIAVQTVGSAGTMGLIVQGNLPEGGPLLARASN